MTKRELKEHLEEYRRRASFVREATYDDLVRETTKQKTKRIARNANPSRYADWFEYYFQIKNDERTGLADCRSAHYHVQGLEWLREMPHINLLNCAFRGGAKSVHGNIGWALNLKFHDKMKFMLLIGSNEDRAKLLLADLQLQLEANEKIIADYGKQLSYGNWSDGMFETKDGTFFMALGIEQPFRGLRRYANRVQYAVIDDLEDRKKALNEGIVRERLEKINRDLGGAYDKNQRREVFSNNFIIRKGLMQAYIKSKKIQVPKLYEGEASPTARALWIPAINEFGKSNWPERYPDTYWKDFQKTVDFYTWNSEYMHNPIEKGRMIRAEWVRYVKPLPYDQYDYLVSRWDMAYRSTGDYFSYILCGVIGTKIHVLQCYTRKAEIADAVNWHYNNKRVLLQKGAITDDYYDAAVAQEAVFEPIWQAAAAQHRSFEIPLPDPSARMDKFQKMASVLINAFQNQTVVFSEEIKDDLDLETGLDQLLALEKGSRAHDDFPDNLASILILIQQNYGSGYSQNDPVFVKHESGNTYY